MASNSQIVHEYKDVFNTLLGLQSVDLPGPVENHVHQLAKDAPKPKVCFVTTYVLLVFLCSRYCCLKRKAQDDPPAVVSQDIRTTDNYATVIGIVDGGSGM